MIGSPNSEYFARLGSDRQRLLDASWLATMMCAQARWVARGGKVVPSLDCCWWRTQEEQSRTESAMPRLSRCFMPIMFVWREEKGVLL